MNIHQINMLFIVRHCERTSVHQTLTTTSLKADGEIKDCQVIFAFKGCNPRAVFTTLFGSIRQLPGPVISEHYELILTTFVTTIIIFHSFIGHFERQLNLLANLKMGA